MAISPAVRSITYYSYWNYMIRIIAWFPIIYNPFFMGLEEVSHESMIRQLSSAIEVQEP